MISAYGNQQPHSLLSWGETPRASHCHIAPESPGQTEGQVKRESGQELFSPMHVTSQCNIWDGPSVILPKCIQQPSKKQPSLSPPFHSSPCCLSSCPQSVQLSGRDIQTHRQCNMGYFPMWAGILCEPVPHPFELSCYSWVSNGWGPGTRALGRVNSQEHTAAPHCADTSSMLVVASPWVTSMECASSSSAETPPPDGVEEVLHLTHRTPNAITHLMVATERSSPLINRQGVICFSLTSPP